MPIDDQPQPQQQTDGKPLEFSITITNGAALRLKNLMEHFKKDTAKDLIGLSLDFLDAIKDGEQIIIKKKDGTVKQLIIAPNDQTS